MKKTRSVRAVLATCWLVLSGGLLAAENSIKQVQVRNDGDQVLLKIQMAAPLKSLPGNWSVVEPPRVVFDFPETDNQSGQSSQQIAVGDLKSLNLAQTDKLTRLVLNLYRPTKFSTEIVGDVLYIKLQTQTVAASQEAAPSIYQPSAQKRESEMAAADTASVRDIVFRRGGDGDAVITVDLTDGTVPIDVRRVADGVVVELRDVELPERLQNKRDVNDFATPVTSISSRAVSDRLTRMDIAAKGRWFHQSRLANNQLTIEIKPIPADDVNKLVQTGQQGQKVSINFFDADATMVLRTLAEISKKNVLVDPSLNGRRVTVNLDNLPYDQALDIIMSQVNAGMRVRNDVILFGDRATLQKRDQDAADEAARANDTAPLTAETFQLNYVKTADVLALISSSFGQTGSTTEAATGAAAPAAATATPAGAAGGGGKGLLSARGSISQHATTGQIFVRDTAAVIESIREVIRAVDVPPKQVMIEARIVEASTGFADALGVRMKYFGNAVTHLGGGANASLGTPSSGGFSNVDAFGAPATPSLVRTSTQGFGTNFTAKGTTAINLMLFNSAATRLLSLELLAAESDSKNKTISAPRVVTQNRKNAKIDNTQQVTLLVGVNAQTGLPIYQTYSAPLTLDVTPSITPDNKIGMDLKIAKSTITNAATGSLDTNTLSTSVIVENGGTVVIGGFARDNDISSEERVPFLGDLPYVGFLFKAKTRSRSRSELLVFITPRIVTDSLTQR
ncbi:MAG: type IV pilus secretin PilQ [Rhodocyclales bacterium]|nr:type IV pilus secretin PilQ [Rhodocyclales bacterium]